MPLNPHRCSASERNHCCKPVQTLQVLMASFLWRALSAASLFEFAAQDGSLFAVVRPVLHLVFDAFVRQIANTLLKFPSRVISHSLLSRLTRIRLQLAICFCLHRGKCPLKGGRMASNIHGSLNLPLCSCVSITTAKKVPIRAIGMIERMRVQLARVVRCK